MKHLCADPCCRCTKVADPGCCENAGCTLWQDYFIKRWNQMRENCRKQMDRIPTEPLGVPLGGFYYAPPHLLRKYRQNNPCKTCVIAPPCKEKCRRRTLWEQQGGIQ